MDHSPFRAIDLALARGETIQKWVRRGVLHEKAWLEHIDEVVGSALTHCTTIRVRQYWVIDHNGQVVLSHIEKPDQGLPSEALIAKLAMAIIGAGFQC